MSRRLSENEVRTLYDRMAFSYDFWGKLTDSRAHERALAWAAISNGEAVLEVCVGTGLLFERVVRANPDGVNLGVDISVGMLSRAASRLSRVPGRFGLQLGSALRLPYRSASFDLLVAAYILDILEEEQHVAILREWSRVVKPTGRMVLVDMTAGEHWYSRLWSLLYRIHPKLMGGCRPVRATPYLSECGWRQIKSAEVSQLSFPSEVILARKIEASSEG